MSVTDRDLGLKKIMHELQMAGRLEVAAGVFDGEIATYGAHNEYGTSNGVPSRPFMAMAFDENVGKINNDVDREIAKVASGRQTARGGLTVIGKKHAERIQNVVTNRDILPKLSPATVRRKKNQSTKTLVDNGALANAITMEVRGR